MISGVSEGEIEVAWPEEFSITKFKIKNLGIKRSRGTFQEEFFISF